MVNERKIVTKKKMTTVRSLGIGESLNHSKYL